tara:strand:- start:2249 stop:2959 length:711 start_codon:yes stop_codon:yes gene_type:complete
MPIIYTYPKVIPAADDLVVLSDASASGKPTKNATAQDIANLDPDNTLAEVLAAGNSATNNIALTGDFTGTGNITRTGNITLTGAQTISTTLGVTGLSTLASVDINGGNIDGTVIGATTDAAGTFTNLVASTLDGVVGSVTPQAGTFTTLTASGNLTVDTNVLHVNATSDSVGIGTASPNAAAVLDVASTSKGLLLPRMDQTQRQAMANVAGMLVWDTTNSKMYVNNGGGWDSVDVS